MKTFSASLGRSTETHRASTAWSSRSMRIFMCVFLFSRERFDDGTPYETIPNVFIKQESCLRRSEIERSVVRNGIS